MSENNTYIRFPVSQRIEHLLLILSFSTLAITGLPQKYPTSPISIAVVTILGGIELVRIIHRVAAAMFLLETIYHLALIGYKLFVQKLEATMLPGIKDAKDAIQAFAYNLGFGKESPRMGRYSFAEKAEYWALIWGGVVMAISGFMLWNPIATASILPGEFIPAAKAAHGGEAVLAVLAIIVWHFYGVHIKTWNWSMIKGTISHHEMEEEHAIELEAIENSAGKVRVTGISSKNQRKAYLSVATIVSLLLVFGLYWFVTLETTAIETIPPASENIQIYSPRTPTTMIAKPKLTPTSAPTKPTQAEAPGEPSE